MWCTVFTLLAIVLGAQGYGNGDVRLAGTSLFNTTGPLGRLEVFMDKEWGTVCSISKGAAQAVCHQLGYEVVVAYDTVLNLGISIASNDTSILLDDVNCDYDTIGEGSQHILRCAYTQQIPTYCNHEVDMAVQCGPERTYDDPYESQVRLLGVDDTPSSGVILVYANQQWGTACYAGFTSMAADSACRQLGYTNAMDHSGAVMSTSTVWIKSTTCSSSQPCLKECFKHPTSPVTCSSDEKVVFVNCSKYP